MPSEPNAAPVAPAKESPAPEAPKPAPDGLAKRIAGILGGVKVDADLPAIDVQPASLVLKYSADNHGPRVSADTEALRKALGGMLGACAQSDVMERPGHPAPGKFLGAVVVFDLLKR